MALLMENSCFLINVNSRYNVSLTCNMLLMLFRAPEIDISELESLFSAAVPNSSQGGKTNSRALVGNKPEIVQLVIYFKYFTFSNSVNIYYSLLTIDYSSSIILIRDLELYS